LSWEFSASAAELLQWMAEIAGLDNAGQDNDGPDNDGPDIDGGVYHQSCKLSNILQLSISASKAIKTADGS